MQGLQSSHHLNHQAHHSRMTGLVAHHLPVPPLEASCSHRALHHPVPQHLVGLQRQRRLSVQLAAGTWQGYSRVSCPRPTPSHVCQAAALHADGDGESTPLEAAPETPEILKKFAAFKPPKWLFRTVACFVLGGQVVVRICQGKVHWRNTLDQLKLVGPNSLGVALLTAGFVGMVFTIQFVREFTKLGLTRSVGGVMALALSRELTPVITAIILAGRVGSAFAAELGTMQVSEQMDSLRVLFTDPVDYLVTPRVLASMVAGPILNVLCFCMGIGASVLLADLVYNVPANVIVDSARRALTAYDVGTSMVKSWVFGSIVSIISCAWGFTTSGGAKGVGESTTSAVVISLVSIFIADFFLSFLFYQGQGDALKQLK